MVLNSKLTESQDFHLSGLLLIIVATVLGLALSLAIFLTEQESRAARDAIAQTVSAPPAVAAPAPAVPSAPAPAATIAPAAVQAAKPPGENPISPPAPSAAGSVAAGSAVFTSNCGGCHPNGGAGVGPALQGLSDDAIVSVTREGAGMMPAFTPDRLSDQQLQDIVAFLRSTN